MIDADRYHHTGRTYVNIFRAFFISSLIPRADAPGYECSAPSRLGVRVLAQSTIFAIHAGLWVSSGPHEV